MNCKLAKLNFKLAVLIAFGLLQTNQCYGYDDDTRPKISVSGTAKIQVKPDQAVFTFSIQSRENKVGEAVEDNDTKVKSVIEFLKASQVDAKDISTQVISIRPIFEQDKSLWRGKSFASPQIPAANAPNFSALPPANDKKSKIKPIGYTVSRQLEITIAKLDSFETIYRGLIERGVNDVSGISFRTTELRKHRDAARLKATQAAREKAEAMAGQLGAKLASVHSINERSHPGWRSQLQNTVSAFAADAGPADSIASGLIEISATVDTVFILRDTDLGTDAQNE